MAKIIVSSWESVGYGHFTHLEQEIDSQYQKIREISDQLGIDIPDLDIHVGSLSTRTEIIADKSVLDHVEPIYLLRCGLIKYIPQCGIWGIFLTSINYVQNV